jgi:phage terminase large subunit
MLDDTYTDDYEANTLVKTNLNIPTPQAFLPFLQPARYKGAEGGRGSGKSHFFAELLIEECVMQFTRAVCGREVQNSIKDSSKQLLEDKIDLSAHRWSGALFRADDPSVKGIYEYGDIRLYDDFMNRWDIKEREIVYKPTDSLIIFKGLQTHTAGSIKSLEGFTRFWGDEAQAFSQRSLDLLTPTFRTTSEMWFSWNPDNPEDPIEKLFRDNEGDPDFIHQKINYYDNPFFPDELRRDMERDRRRDIDKYNHTWLGHYKKNSEAKVFHNYVIDYFDTPPDATFLQGADWGFSVDPTVLVRGFLGRWEGPPGARHAVFDPAGKTLFIDHEAYQVGCEISDTAKLFDSLITGDEHDPEFGIARRFQIRADSARPETISAVKKAGYPLIVPSTKGPQSVIDGIEFLKDYDIVIHKRCKHTADEFDNYKFKIDKMTSKVTNVLEDKKNHVIDAIRYMVEILRKIRKQTTFGASETLGASLGAQDAVAEQASSKDRSAASLGFGDLLD